MSERTLVRKAEAAELLGNMPESTLEKLTSKKKIPHVKIGAAVYYDTVDLWAWVESQKVASSVCAPA
jgi:excisionase family DNA binding protein